MTKTLVLETVSYKQKRAKFTGDTWITVSPFIKMDDLTFGTTYNVELAMDKSGQWYVEKMVPQAKE